ncbi:MAG: hypothetical protein IE881_05490, partial [Epsilonproteobacteria bacterium]|nr:hypothetical protein [Campylobacterota bacterium]
MEIKISSPVYTLNSNGIGFIQKENTNVPNWYRELVNSFVTENPIVTDLVMQINNLKQVYDNYDKKLSYIGMN